QRIANLGMERFCLCLRHFNLHFSWGRGARGDICAVMIFRVNCPPSRKATGMGPAIVMQHVRLPILVLCILPQLLFAVEPLQRFDDVRLFEHTGNDGDSFHVELDGNESALRLYFVDCPETSASNEVLARRVREQTRYFGLPSAAETIALGKEATAFTRRQLAEPFTVHTAFAHGGGSGKVQRYYAFMTTAAGDDLGSLLVANGYGRAHGVGRLTPTPTTQAEHWEYLRDLEASAMLSRKGIWQHSVAERLASDRAAQRRDDDDWMRVREEVSTQLASGEGININVASRGELMQVKGIGPGLAQTIIEDRPYTNVADLARCRGIGEKKLDAFSPYLTVN
ncbi:MAG: helix-hairpin-helix domain-containing protein, partial [Verrucomicrobia bacterium]|nr:helix-hairpin-helix domain-containing protein [Verrucomicrobiota bacterium]